MVAALPLGGKRAQRLAQFVFALFVFGESKSFFARVFQKFAITQRIGNMKSHFAGLASAKKFSGSAQLQIGFGNLETVAGAHHCFETSASVISHMMWRNQDAMRFLRAAADTSAQLMQLRKTEAFRVFDDHHGCVRNVDANFDDGSGY